MKTLDKWQGHIVLYCKNHYNVKDVDFIIGLRRIWGVRCGLAAEHINKSIDEYIADELYRTIVETHPQERLLNLWQVIHKDIADDWKFGEEVSVIQRLIHIYSHILLRVKIREDKKILVKLPQRQKQLFKRIVRGNGRSNDYKKVK